MGIIIIGAGRVGKSMGYLLNRAGFNILGVYNKHFDSAVRSVKKIGSGKPLHKDDLVRKIPEARLVMITTPDDKIADIAAEISNYKREKPLYLMHMSGLHRSSILYSEQSRDINVFSLHPLQAIPNFEEGIKLLPEAAFTLEGDTEGLAFAKKLAEKLDLNYSIIESKYKALYHASAVIASNYLVTLLNTSFKMLEEADLKEQDLKKGLLNLVKGTLNNCEKMDPEKALTGPIARGDKETLREHIEAIQEYSPEFLDLYRILGDNTVKMVGNEDLEEIFNRGG